MEKLVFDSGLKEYEMPGGILRFNPGDPNIYARFVESADKIRTVEKKMSAKAKTIMESNPRNAGEESLRILHETDKQIKTILNDVFGCNNDFDTLLCGINLMAVANNGERVITNLLEALKPIMENGAKACVSDEVRTAKMNREQRRSAQK